MEIESARNMQGALLERRGELVRENSMCEGRLSDCPEGERQNAWAAVRAEKALESAKMDYVAAVTKGLPESIVNALPKPYVICALTLCY